MKPEDQPPAAAELRTRAEAAFQKKTAQSPESLETLSPEATEQLLHELRVHQIELEMQNEELRRAQVELDVSRARYFDLYDLAPVGYVTLSEAGLIQQANLTIATLLGVTRGDLAKQPLSRFIQKEDADGYYLLRKKLVATGVARACDLRLVKSDGTICWAHLTATVNSDEGAPVIRIVLLDLTARQQAEQALRLASQKLRLHFEQTPMAVIEWDLDFRVTRWNPAAQTIFGHSSAEAVGQHASFIVPEAFRPHVDQIWQALMKRGGGERSSNENVRKDGKTILCEWYNTALIDERGAVAGVASVVDDITARQQAEAALAASQAALREANENLRVSNEELEGRILARTAQLRALTTELIHTEERERLRLADTLHEGLLQVLAAASFHLTTLEGQVAEGAAADSFGKLHLCLTEAINAGRSLTHEIYPPALHSLGLGSALQWLGQWFHEKHGLSVEVAAAPEICVAEKELGITLFRAAKELLNNVHKHAQVRRARVSLRRAPGPTVRLVVSDTGVGFDPAAVQAREGSSGGFGLFSLRERIEALGGRFHVRSAPGRGSRFTVTVATAERPVAPRQRPARSVPVASKTKVRRKPVRTP